ncbi:cadherin-like domain-containing protein [Rhizobium sp. 1399]|jgi:Ca2+-binding RTX toxin-like protein|uniref:cadherin-like domain-containing protein n=1 Tax=Rhizobium sp. 1399 TaxID=2817758 RepID=UPI002855E767|nr:cadherin-like domain-containing protein [Rhizobium sp. 1399]MDR6667689.1 Ca2+-binding RTX toxin-like protein [Rhizobium sp. 1399]
MIEVKGTKTVKEEDDPHDRYVFKNEDKLSKVPMFMTLFLTGFALYLKSALSSQPEALPIGETEPRPTPDPKEGLSPIDPVSTGAIAPQETEEEEKAPTGKKGGVQLSNYKNAISHPLEDSPPIEFNRLSLPSLSLLKTSGGVSVSFHASNDNAWKASKPISRAPFRISDDHTWTGPSQASEAAPERDEVKPPPAPEKAPNRAPRAGTPVALADVSGCAIALIGLADLLRGTLDPDGDPLSVKDITVSSGRLVQTTGGWTYQADGLGPVTVHYQITDGMASVVQTASFSVVKPAPIIGTNGDDLLVGTSCGDDIDGLGGNDNIDARGGSDTINGGDGNDNIVAGSGDDTIFAGNGHDIVLGGLGNDHIFGGNGNDRLYGEEGRDSIFGDDGDDLLSGGGDADILHGGDGNDTLNGDAGNDVLEGEGANDSLFGGDGDDILLGQTGTDNLSGGAGNDVLSGGSDQDTVRGDDGNDTVAGDADRADDTYDGGTGIDTLDYSALAEVAEINLAAGSASGTEIGADTIANFEIVRAGAGDDSVTGSAEAEELHGNTGDDHLCGGDGADLVKAGDGNDVVTGDLDCAADSYDGGDGIDTLDYSAAVMSVVVDLNAADVTGEEIGSDGISNFEIIKTGDGNDMLRDGDAAECLSAGGGDDIVIAAADASDDDFQGGDGFDTIDYSQAAHAVLIDLNTGTATGFDVGYDAVGGFEKVVGGAGNDIVRVGPVAAVIEGGAGEDMFEFTVPAGEDSAAVVHQILDFMVGDRIDVSKYKIFEEVMDGLEDRFEEIYGDKADVEPLPIRVRHEGTDEMSRTFIEVDMDKDQHYEMTINLTGHHLLVIVENT